MQPVSSRLQGPTAGLGANPDLQALGPPPVLQQDIDALLIKARTFPGQTAPVAMDQANIGQQQWIARQFKNAAGPKIRLPQSFHEPVGLFQCNSFSLLRIYCQSFFNDSVPIVHKGFNLFLGEGP